MTWDMYAAPSDHHEKEWLTVGDRRYVRMHGCADPVPVRLTEDPAADYLGWIETGEDIPVMIHHKKIFDICFPYGSAAEVEKGRGRVVPLRIEERETN